MLQSSMSYSYRKTPTTKKSESISRGSFMARKISVHVHRHVSSSGQCVSHWIS